ncbi:MAG: NUDIX domain-containing protein [Alphaproteobacteria bacterium]|nr:NUDIX domain-containing protein [Alphaproteobacteria bacterium]
MNQDDVEIVEKKKLYRGHLTVNEFILRHKLFNGGMTKPISREVVQRAAAVGVLPYDPIRDEVVLIRQFRAGVMVADHNPWLIESVAGLVEEGETAEDVARRESIEEAGCEISELHHICDFFASPGMLSECVTMYCGITDTTNAGGLHGLEQEDEDIEAIVVPWSQLCDDIDTKKHFDAKIMLGVMWLTPRREDLRKRFTG